MAGEGAVFLAAPFVVVALVAGDRGLKIATIQNCHSGPTAQFLTKALGNPEIEQFRLDVVGWNDPAAQEAFLDRVATADLVLAQRTRQPLLSPAALKANFGDRLLLVSNMHYAGLTPDCCYVGQRDGRVDGPMSYHSSVIIDAYKRGLSVADCLKLFSPEGFADLRLFDVHEEALAELAARDAQVPVKIVPIIRRFLTTDRLFYTMNHPTMFLVSRYMMALLRHLGIRHRRVDTAGIRDVLKAGQVLPIHDFVAAHFELKYRSTQLYQNHANFMDLRQVVEGFYKAYAAKPRESITVGGVPRPVYAADPERFGHLIGAQPIA
ncbi:WcbI family polysaccharide biosynthesis putative acetyltransferase [Acuticoccus sp. MNP-M23]|uniref:WcbI family polysaccharide biosynthesis putative acetyltransferase n=1 Tax=Acuticoccus sp. MNP-M23 TaxID=3072793 RepID=UPI002815C449|nr:WcbI family polysaccharide biosynthesis putative acetyltransferase [Acuticoccus sp. MNP-M23]WMS40817.1 WcbI family polysaccharide biosynthesis putative acetyltransferase [Acuticoccus sp. MNP-M23]